jgi:hypothetical protein
MTDRIPAGMRRSDPTTTGARRRTHPAQRSRIAAAGVGMATMFGVVAGLGYAQRSGATAAATEPQPPIPQPAAQVYVVVHHTTAGDTATASGAVQGSSGTSSAAVPIPLTAQRTVVPAPAAASAPVAQTHGSR